MRQLGAIVFAFATSIFPLSAQEQEHPDLNSVPSLSEKQEGVGEIKVQIFKQSKHIGVLTTRITPHSRECYFTCYNSVTKDYHWTCPGNENCFMNCVTGAESCY